ELGELWRDRLYQWIEETYRALSNHCYLAILIAPFREDDEDGQWRLFSDLTLYAEKHRETPLRTGYFRPDEIAAATAGHGVPIDPVELGFERPNGGFLFRVCIVLPRQSAAIETSSPACELLLLEKNERDETLLPCPACRSKEVRGNSYPVLGVKSWECRQPL